jgi:2-oxoglutarate ferredoxin oxidoreductase subunit beta
MPTTIDAPQELTLADLKGKVDPDWCPGCGDFGVLAAVQKALVELQIPNHNVVSISGSAAPPTSRFHQYLWMHPRPRLAVATGVKLANHDLTVLVTGGDGDGFASAATTVHTMRQRRPLYIARTTDHGLTTGQTSHQPHRHEDQEMPFGNIEARQPHRHRSRRRCHLRRPRQAQK